MTLRHLDLFSGIGGFALGLERAGFETVGFCEIDPFCQKVLAKNFPHVPIHSDVRTINGWIRSNDIRFDVLTGGYPCQPFSQAGKRGGEEDDRHLWPAMFDVIEAFRPTWVIGENVAGHISLGLDAVLSDLEGSGYAVQAFVIPACAVDAPHRRDRVWIVAHNDDGHELADKAICTRRDSAFAGCPPIAHAQEQPVRAGLRKNEQGRLGRRRSGNGGGEDVSNTKRQRRRGGDGKRQDAKDARQLPGSEKHRRRLPESRLGGMADGLSPWLVEPDIPRVAKGVKDRVNRLKGLGNAVVPQIPEIIGTAILETEK